MVKAAERYDGVLFLQGTEVIMTYFNQLETISVLGYFFHKLIKGLLQNVVGYHNTFEKWYEISSWSCELLFVKVGAD